MSRVRQLKHLVEVRERSRTVLKNETIRHGCRIYYKRKRKEIVQSLTGSGKKEPQTQMFFLVSSPGDKMADAVMDCLLIDHWDISQVF